MDESAKHLLQDKREPLSMQKGRPQRVDDTFESAGMCKIFLACEPLAGKRFVKITEHRTSCKRQGENEPFANGKLSHLHVKRRMRA